MVMLLIGGGALRPNAQGFSGKEMVSPVAGARRDQLPEQGMGRNTDALVCRQAGKTLLYSPSSPMASTGQPDNAARHLAVSSAFSGCL